MGVISLCVIACAQ